MTQFILRRLLVTIPVLLGIVFIVFALARLVPGDPCRAVLGERATDAVCDDFIHRYGLDQPIPVQFVRVPPAARRAATSATRIKHSRPVTDAPRRAAADDDRADDPGDDLRDRRRRPARPHLGRTAATRPPTSARWSSPTSASRCPVFVLGLLLAYLFAIVLKDTPFVAAAIGPAELRRHRRAARRGLGPAGLDRAAARDPRLRVGHLHVHALITGQWGAAADAFRHLILPAIALGTIPLAIIARITRSSLLEVLGLDYVRTARAKGLGERAVVLRHAARNALLPGRDDHRPAARARCCPARS